MKQINEIYLKKRIREWLHEDMPYGDITSEYAIEDDNIGRVSVIAKEDGIICGLFLAKYIFEACNSDIASDFMVEDGAYIKRGQELGTIMGPMKGILQGERLFLNLLQRLSGIATASSKYKEAIKGFHTRIVDTRKTTPGLRDLEKYAVKVGGCHNHRFSLSDGVMLKDNHIRASGSIKSALVSIKEQIPHTMKVEVETENLEGVREAIGAGADIIMLDNMSRKEMVDAVSLIREKSAHITIEASGNMTLERVRDVAKTGVDVISVGAITHSVTALDISMKYL